jgi:hypothetical protein
MSDNDSDPTIVKRLDKLPPFVDEEPQAPVEEVVETPVEEKVEEPVEEVKEEVVETKEEVTEEEALKESKQPEHTKKFIEKLKEQNKELKKNVLDSLQPEPEPAQWPQSPTTNIVPSAQQFPGLSQAQITDTFKGLVDENGYVDSGLLINSLKEQKERNDKLQQEVIITKQETQKTNKRLDDFERNEVMKGVHAQFPTLDPNNDNFDEKLWKFVRNEVVDQWMNGKPTDVMAAATEGMEVLHGGEMKRAEKEQLEKTETAKRNINAIGASQTTQRETYTDHDALVTAVQHGKRGALAERLAKSGY